MKVYLINYTKEPLNVIYTSARTCYSSFSPNEILEKETSVDKMQELVKKLFSSGHHSVFEHVSFTFGIEGISRACSHQLVRHRIASYSQQSQRYVKPQDVVLPDSIKSNEILLKKFNNIVDNCFKLYNEFIEAGIPLEDARYILPNATKTNIVMTMNFREIMAASSLRLCLRAQWEIRRLFEEIKNLISTIDKFLSEFLSPKCIHLGYCPEEETCGLMPKK